MVDVLTDWPRADGPYSCHFCGRQLRTKYDRRAIEGWAWFTGSGGHTMHFCPACLNSKRRSEIDAIASAVGVNWVRPF